MRPSGFEKGGRAKREKFFHQDPFSPFSANVPTPSQLFPLFIQFFASRLTGQFQHPTLQIRLVASPILLYQTQTAHHTCAVEPFGLVTSAVQIPRITAPLVALEPLLSDPDEPGARRVEMNVGADDLEIHRLLTVHDDRFIAALEEMSKYS